MISFWEKTACYESDFLVIGAGVIGLSTAIELRLRLPDRRVTVLERGLISEGASTKNAGFACFGSITEILSDFSRCGINETLSVVERRWRGLSLLRQRVGDSNMEFKQHGGYELLFDGTSAVIKQLDDVNSTLLPIFGQSVFSLANEKIAEFGFDGIHTLVYNPFEGQIHSGKMMMALRKVAVNLGVEIHSGTNVISLSEQQHTVIAEVIAGLTRANFTAHQVVVCTNSLMSELLPEVHITPGRGQVLLTEPIDGLPFQGVFHFDEGYYYFRNVGKRILFGGGRNLDFAGENVAEFGLTDNIQHTLEDYLRRVILPRHEFAVAERWSGIMGFSADKLPIVRRISPHIIAAFGCNGMGVALGSVIGSDTAALVADSL